MIFTPVIGSRTETGMVLGKKDESWSSFSRYSLSRSVQEFYFRECSLFMGRGGAGKWEGGGKPSLLPHLGGMGEKFYSGSGEEGGATKKFEG